MEGDFLHILHLHPLCKFSGILYGELRILLYATDSDPDWDESDLECSEIVLEIEEIILGPIGRDIDIVVRVVLCDMLFLSFLRRRPEGSALGVQESRICGI